MSLIDDRLWVLERLRSVGLLNIDYEAVLEQNYRKIIEPGNWVVDVGAHEARHLDIFKSIVGPDGFCLGVEPIPDFTNALVKRFEGDKNVEIGSYALSNQVGQSVFVIADGCPSAIRAAGAKI